MTGGASWIIAVSYCARWFENSHGGDNEKFHLLLLDEPEERGNMIVRNVGTYTGRDVHKNGNLLHPISSNFSKWNVGGCSKVDMLPDDIQNFGESPVGEPVLWKTTRKGVDWSLAKSRVQWQALVLASLTPAPLMSEIRFINSFVQGEADRAQVGRWVWNGWKVAWNKSWRTFFLNFGKVHYDHLYHNRLCDSSRFMSVLLPWCSLFTEDKVTVIMSLYKKHSHHASFLQLIIRIGFSLSSRGAFQITAT
jgi:hypothetical protein